MVLLSSPGGVGYNLLILFAGLRLECKYAAKRIMEVTETSQPMREKILMELADVSSHSSFT